MQQAYPSLTQPEKTPLRTQWGSGLLELLLSLAVMATVSLSVINMSQRAQSKERGRWMADTLQSFTQVAAQYFIANRSAIEIILSGELKEAAQFCAINVTDKTPSGVPSANALKHTCAVDASFLRARGLWPESLPLNAGQSRWAAVFRQLQAPDGGSAAQEMLVFLAVLDQGSIKTQGATAYTGLMPEFVEQTQASLASLGAMGGYIPPGKDYGACQYNALLKQACGQGWRVNLEDFL
jgi:hypothetical protein